MAFQGQRDPNTLSGLGAGDLGAVETLYDQYGKMAYSLAYRIVKDAGSAEDVVQEAFLSIWRNAHRFNQQRGSLRNWVLSIVHHRAIDSLRGPSGRSRQTVEISTVQNALQLPDVWEQVSVGVQRDAILVALERLPREQRETISLAYYGGLTHVEIAERMAVPLGTVKGRMRLALEKLRQDLDAHGLKERE